MAIIDFYLKKVYAKWQTLMNSIITGSCGCIKTCHIYYKEPTSLEDCDRYGQQETGNSYGQACEYDKPYEVIDIAVFTDERKFIRVENLINVPSGVIQTITNETNFIKLKQADFIRFNVDDALIMKEYKRLSDGETCGFDDTYKYYVLMWEKV